MSPDLALPDLFHELPPPFAAGWDPEAPWALLEAPLDSLLADLPSERIEVGLAPDAHLVGDRIVIGRGTRVAPGAMLEGPLFIGEDVDIRTGAYLRAGVWIGDGCTIGANTEIKRSILLPGAKAPHLNYVGDSILGASVNLGAGTVLSNFRHDGGEVTIKTAGGPLATGRRKLGAILGDGVNTGCNCVLHPGVIVGRRTDIYPLVQLRSGIYDADTVVKLRQELVVSARKG